MRIVKGADTNTCTDAESSVGTIRVELNAVVMAATERDARVLVVRRPGDAQASLPSGALDPQRDRTLELALRGWIREQTGLELGYVEQLYTFGDRDRIPGAQSAPGTRTLSVAYLALVNQHRPAAGLPAAWRDWYAYFPWEDGRDGPNAVRERVLEPALRKWAERGASPARRRERLERAEIAFGFGRGVWDGERVLERYELLYGAGLVDEAHRDAKEPVPRDASGQGEPLALDHRRILATAASRLRGKLKYRPLVFELLPPTFTFLQLQRVVEALAGTRLHKQNFRRLVAKAGLVEGTGRRRTDTGGRPAELFRFRPDVLRERPAPGVRLPGERAVRGG